MIDILLIFVFDVNSDFGVVGSGGFHANLPDRNDYSYLMEFYPINYKLKI